MKKKDLIIVESPAKSKTISNYLGKNYYIESSMGHIRDLSPHILSIDVEKNFNPYYEILKNKKQLVSKIEKLAKNSNLILLATDPDREGEAIAFHLKEILKKTNKNIFRVLFHEITKNAIVKAVSNPQELDHNKIDSQQMRRILDRLAGYKISPILQKKLGGPLSAGRVQSIALKLIVEKEKEIEAFVSEEFWTIEAEFEGSKKPSFISKLEKKKNKKIKIRNKDENQKILDDLDKNDYILDSIEKNIKKRKPSAPFITSTLQQTAYQALNYSVKRTMQIAQKLYEGIEMNASEMTGLITYMRTDSHRISQEAQVKSKEFIIKTHGPEYAPEKFNFFGKKTKSQDAHEAIRPTLPFYPPETVKDKLPSPQYRLYKLIWDRFFASQMEAARIAQTVFNIKNGDYLFKTQGEVVQFQGFLKLQKLKTNIQELAILNEKEVMKLLHLDPKQNFTKPPARFTEASLVKTLEKEGIGRPSTYVTIIDILNKRDYVFREEKKFKPTFLGTRVVDFLVEHFDDLMDIKFSANLELELDKVSQGEKAWQKGIDEFYKRLKDDLDRVNPKEKTPLEIGINCPKCSNPLVMKYSYKTRGWFTACSAYPKCKHIHKEKEEEKEEKTLDKLCPKCESQLVERFSPKTKSHFIGCSGYPKCNYIEVVEENLGKCPQCEKPLIKKFSKRTKRQFIACSGYPDCKYIPKTTKKSE